MKTRLITAITLIALAIPLVCSAAPGRPGPYFSGFLGTNFTHSTDVSGFDSGNNPFSDRVTFDPGIYAGGTGGYDFGFMRLEGELSYRQANLDTITATGFNLRSIDGEVGTYATMFNVFFDMHNATNVTPYIGGGIGFATIHLSDTFGYDTIGGKVRMYAAGDDTVFASQVGGGLDIALTSHYSLDLGYRYFITERANFDSRISSSFRLENHNASVGFRFKF